MMRRIIALVLFLVGPALAAQQPVDTGGTLPAQRLRQQIRQRWNVQVRRQLALTDDQAVQLRATEERFFEQRREIQQRQRAVFQGLRAQLQPGVAADADSVRKLLDAREQNRAAMARLDRDEDSEMAGYLSPIQRARYQLMRQRLQERIAEMRRQRRERFFGPWGQPRP
jgi:membrane-bound lytic murein transglycosylase